MTETDLKEYPEDYKGRKSYVFIRSIGQVVAACYTYSSNGTSQLLPEYGGPEILDHHNGNNLMVMRDIGEYTSIVDGERISSRSHHREHIRRHDLVELGNERGPVNRVEHNMPSIRQDIRRELERARAG